MKLYIIGLYVFLLVITGYSFSCNLPKSSNTIALVGLSESSIPQVIALQDIPKGHHIFQESYNAHIATQLTDIPENLRPYHLKIHGCYLYPPTIDDVKIVWLAKRSAEDANALGYFLDNNIKHWSFHAIKDIKAGEEIVLRWDDYSLGN